MGWLTSATEWLAGKANEYWQAFTGWAADVFRDVRTWVDDIGVTALETMLDLFATVVEKIPVPEVLTTYSLGGLLANAGPDVLWLVGVFRIDECFALFAGALSFRLLRKILTLGQW